MGLGYEGKLSGYKILLLASMLCLKDFFFNTPVYYLANKSSSYYVLIHSFETFKKM